MVEFNSNSNNSEPNPREEALKKEAANNIFQTTRALAAVIRSNKDRQFGPMPYVGPVVFYDNKRGWCDSKLYYMRIAHHIDLTAENNIEGVSVTIINMIKDQNNDDNIVADVTLRAIFGDADLSQQPESIEVCCLKGNIHIIDNAMTNLDEKVRTQNE